MFKHVCLRNCECSLFSKLCRGEWFMFKHVCLRNCECSLFSKLCREVLFYFLKCWECLWKHVRLRKCQLFKQHTNFPTWVEGVWGIRYFMVYVRWMDGSLLSQLGSHDVGGVASISPVYHGECLNHIPQNATDLAWGKKEKENKVV